MKGMCFPQLKFIMNNNFIDFDQMFKDYLNRPISEQLRDYHFYDKKRIGNIMYKNKDIRNDFNEFVEVKNNDELNELQELINRTSDFGKPKVNLYSSYILGIDKDNLKFAQYSSNYLFDDLMEIKAFLSSEHKKFDKALKYLYFIDEKHKYKYVEKAKQKGKKTFYFDDSFGPKILNYIDGQKMNVLGDKYGVQNYILDNITKNDNLQKKFIIILSFDVELFEIYYSVPYSMYEKGSNELENELVYCCRMDEIEPNEILNYLNDNVNNYI